MNRCVSWWDISEVSEVGVTIIQQFHHLGPFTHPLSSTPSVDHGYNNVIVTQLGCDKG